MNDSDAAQYEPARRLANSALWAVALQCRRLSWSEPEDDAFVFRRWADFDFLLVALRRFRRAVGLASPLVPGLQAELDAFDAKLPDLNFLRNVSEHVDDYALGRGRDRSVDPKMLQVSTLSDDGPTLSWLIAEDGHSPRSLNASVALAASKRLFEALQLGRA